ncbi:MAG: tRNA (adenosine(37)-N6)-dimethylallyltransferase MiaA [Acidimicrobiia bacterium]|nr:tRNA (adenosine(37)-N6)-dimethylallyltransferase MiaA [Acidimicrobiia bacterium]
MLGPTAAGKSEIALALAESLRAPIISVDSMQIYRGMDIGTAKPSRADRERVSHYMIDLVDPDSEYSVAQFQREARQILDSDRHEVVLVVGGSGLHFRAVVDPHSFPPHDPRVRGMIEQLMDPAAALMGVDPGAGNVIDLSNRRRVVRALEIHRLTGLTPTVRAAQPEADALRRYQAVRPFTAVGIDPGDVVEERISLRVERMRADGLLEEVKDLANRFGKTSRNAVGYRQLLGYLAGGIDLDRAWEEVQRATVGLARRQRTYFRRDPRIRWLPWDPNYDARLSSARAILGVS